MILRYRSEPESFFALLALCLRGNIGFAEFRCRRAWKRERSEPDLFACAETDAAYGEDSVDLVAEEGASGSLARELSRCAPGAVEDLLYAFLSEESIEANAIAFARCALRGDIAKLNDETDPDSRAILRAARRVRKEIHAFQGLLRFDEEPDGRFVARFEPDFDITRELFPFFRARFGSTPFSIVDERRGRRLDSDTGAESESSHAAARENEYWKGLWKTFYASTENPLRANPRLRLQHMPKRYWKRLPEVEDKT